MSILDEVRYILFGGWTGTATHDQVLLALDYADEQAASVIGTRPVPQLCSGTYALTSDMMPFHLHHQRVLGLVSAEGVWPDAHRGSVILELVDPALGLVQPWLSGTSSFGAFQPIPSRIDVTYWAGYPTGTFTADPGVAAALTAVAKDFLRQMVDPSRSEGGEGSPGIQSFTSQKYSETRVKLRETPLGNSALMNWAYKRLLKWRLPHVGRL